MSTQERLQEIEELLDRYDSGRIDADRLQWLIQRIAEVSA